MAQKQEMTITGFGFNAWSYLDSFINECNNLNKVILLEAPRCQCRSAYKNNAKHGISEVTTGNRRSCNNRIQNTDKLGHKPPSTQRYVIFVHCVRQVTAPYSAEARTIWQW